jgi:hypothetical protein
VPAVTVTDLVGPARGDAAGLRALAVRLRRAAAVLAEPRDAAAVLDAAAAVDTAADALRALPVPPPPGSVLGIEAALAADLAAPLALLTPEGNR